jgi:hypothetical protein
MDALRKKNKQIIPDKLYIGLITGTIVPLVAFFVYYKLKFGSLEFFDYVSSMHQYKLLFKVISLCVLSDLPVFYLFMHFKKMHGARGVVMACFFYAFMVLVYRIIN